MARTKKNPNLEPEDDLDVDPDYGDDGEDEVDPTYDDNGFEVDEALTKPTTVVLTTKQLHFLVHQAAIDLDAEYQRDVVWKEAKQSHLIDSLFRNIYIPPLVFAVSMQEDGSEVQMCVDGKQRLTSIVKFFDGQIPFRDRSGKAWWFQVPPSKKRGNQIPDHWKEEFSEKTLTCVHYSNLSPDVEREIFQRVQMGVVLRESEKMQAITSPRVDFIRELQRRFIESGQDNTCLADVIDMKVARAQDFQTLAQVVFCVGNLPAEPNYSAGPIDRWLRVQDPVPNQLRMGVIHALTHMYNLATTPGLDSVYKKVDKALAPVEFVFLAILMYRAGDDFTNEERADFAYQMRVSLRSNHKDVFARKDCFKALTRYIESVVGACDQEAVPLAPYISASRKSKRKTGAPEDSEDPDFVPGKKARTRKATARA